MIFSDEESANLTAALTNTVRFADALLSACRPLRGRSS